GVPGQAGVAHQRASGRKVARNYSSTAVRRGDRRSLLRSWLRGRFGALGRFRPLLTYPAAARSGILSGVETCAVNPTSSPAPGADPLSQQPLRHARQQAGYYRALHRRATQREAKLKEQLAHCHADWAARLHHRETELQQRITDLEAEVRLLKQRLYGRSCEAHHAPTTLAHGPTATGAAAGVPAPPPRRRRGQQPGRPSPGRRPYARLPTTPEPAHLPPAHRQC